MNRLLRTEMLLLNALSLRENSQGALPLLEADLDLHEKDPINRIRELVFYIEKLEREGLVVTEPGFYEESDHMSFTYLNSAVELREERVCLSEEGRRLVAGASSVPGRYRRALEHLLAEPECRTLLTALCIVSLAAGLAAGYLIGRGV